MIPQNDVFAPNITEGENINSAVCSDQLIAFADAGCVSIAKKEYRSSFVGSEDVVTAKDASGESGCNPSRGEIALTKVCLELISRMLSSRSTPAPRNAYFLEQYIAVGIAGPKKISAPGSDFSGTFRRLIFPVVPAVFPDYARTAKTKHSHVADSPTEKRPGVPCSFDVEENFPCRSFPAMMNPVQDQVFRLISYAELTSPGGERCC